jgi:hypothetical protein
MNIHLKCGADCAVDEEVDGRVEDHEEPGHRIQFVELHRGDVLTAGLDASDDQAGKQNQEKLSLNIRF